MTGYFDNTLHHARDEANMRLRADACWRRGYRGTNETAPIDLFVCRFRFRRRRRKRHDRSSIAGRLDGLLLALQAKGVRGTHADSLLAAVRVGELQRLQCREARSVLLNSNIVRWLCSTDRARQTPESKLVASCFHGVRLILRGWRDYDRHPHILLIFLGERQIIRSLRCCAVPVQEGCVQDVTKPAFDGNRLLLVLDCCGLFSFYTIVFCRISHLQLVFFRGVAGDTSMLIVIEAL